MVLNVVCCAVPQLLDRHLVSSECGGAQALGSLDSQLAETEDVLSYVSDLLSLGELATAFFSGLQIAVTHSWQMHQPAACPAEHNVVCSLWCQAAQRHELFFCSSPASDRTRRVC
jgi:hypothetical protein